MTFLTQKRPNATHMPIDSKNYLAKHMDLKALKQRASPMDLVAIKHNKQDSIHAPSSVTNDARVNDPAAHPQNPSALLAA